MRNIAPTRTLSRRSRDLLYASGLTILLGVLIVVVAIFLFVFSLSVPSNPDYVLYQLFRYGLLIIGIVVVVAGIVMVIRALTWKVDNELAMAVGKELGRSLDDRFTLIRNVSKLSVGYVDAVLVGPPGVLVFRITDKSGTFYNEGDKWMFQKSRGKWSTIRWNPTREVIHDINQLQKYFSARGMPEVPIQGVIVFTNEPPLLMVTTESSVVPVAYTGDVRARLDQVYFEQDRISAESALEIVRSLYN